MRLFSTSAETDNKDDGNRIILDRSKVVLISRNQKVQADIKNILKMHNVNNVVQKKISINEYLDDASTKDAGWMVLDIDGEKDINVINDVTSLIVPYDVYYVLVGNTDSIAFAKSLEKSGGRYLYIDTQLNELPDIIVKALVHSTDRSTLRISILGCKGGCGTTTISSGILSSLNKYTSVPCLLVQGATGSRDFDLITGHKLDSSDSKVQKITDNRSVKFESNNDMFNYTDPVFNQFNIALFDHNATAISTENLESIFNHSNTIVLIIGRNFSSFRTAKRIMDEYIRFERQKTDSIMRKLVLCINEYNPGDNRSKFSNEDITEYLGCEINAILPHFQVRKENDAFTHVLQNLAATVLGRDKEDSKENKNILSGFLNRINIFSKK